MTAQDVYLRRECIELADNFHVVRDAPRVWCASTAGVIWSLRRCARRAKGASHVPAIRRHPTPTTVRRVRRWSAAAPLLPAMQRAVADASLETRLAAPRSSVSDLASAATAPTPPPIAAPNPATGIISTCGWLGPPLVTSIWHRVKRMQR